MDNKQFHLCNRMVEEYECPFTFEELNEEDKNLMGWLRSDLVRLPPKKGCAPSLMKKYAKEIYNFKPRPDDIWLIGYPRSGTTLTQEILYLLGTDLNYEKAASAIMDFRFPVLHSAIYGRDESLADKSSEIKQISTPAHMRLAEQKEKRFIKSHYGFDFIHPEIFEIGCKIVFIARNPKDVMVSYYYYPSFQKLEGHNFEKFWQIFKRDLTLNGEYFEMLQDGWQKRHHKNVLFLFYEEVNSDKRAAVVRIANFLGKNITEDQIETLLKHIQIDQFKKNKSLNNDHFVDLGIYAKNDQFSFIRNGKSGSWKDLFPQELVPEIDEWIKNGLASIPDFEMPESWRKIMELK